MGFSQRIINKINSAATGSERKKSVLAPVIGSIFAVVTAMFVVLPVNIEDYFSLPELLIPPLNLIFGILFFIPGILLMLWATWLFFAGKRTPVPVNPPDKLITNGPYRFMRNPMHSGMFMVMFAFGFYHDSILAIFIFIPLYIYLDVWYFKNVEEPELEKRLGADYIEYKKKVPMFFPKNIFSP
jgi:protein-S-isoprenylcysteine O-methyltransferase Ste14